jgi:DNA-binding transcriptional MerR regulator
VTDLAPRHTLRKLAELTGTKVRTLRRWVHSGAISATEFRGPATSYGARHVDEARAIKRLLAENLSLEAIRARLTRLSDEDLASFVRPEAVAGVVGPAVSEAAAPDATVVTVTPADAEVPCDVERWEHVTLLPGLKLLVRGDSGALVRRIAREIQERYAVAKR